MKENNGRKFSFLLRQIQRQGRWNALFFTLFISVFLFVLLSTVFFQSPPQTTTTTKKAAKKPKTTAMKTHSHSLPRSVSYNFDTRHDHLPQKMSLSGHATPSGTRRFMERSCSHRSSTNIEIGNGEKGLVGTVAAPLYPPEEHFNTFNPTREEGKGLVLSSVGMGTYLGDPNRRTDEQVVEALIHSISSGVINVIDTASNYRGGRAEMSIGDALNRMITNDDSKGNRGMRKVNRDELFVCTKAGFVATKELQQRAVQKGAMPEDFGAGGRHCVSPACLEASLDMSLERMGLEAVDVLYLHNVAEKRADEVSSANDLKRLLSRAFVHLEHERQRGRIRYYGLATFSKSFRVPPGSVGYLNLSDLVDMARAAARIAAATATASEEVDGDLDLDVNVNVDMKNDDHGFRFVQVPVSPLSMPEAYTALWQEVAKTTTTTTVTDDNVNVNVNVNINIAPSQRERERVTLVEAAQRLGVGIVSSKSLGVTGGGRGKLRASSSSSSCRAGKLGKSEILHVTRSAPGLLCALVGHKQRDHVTSNLKAVSEKPPLSSQEFRDMVSNC